MFLDKILPQLEAPDSTEFFPPTPTYYAFGLSPDKQQRQQLACHTQEELVQACESFMSRGWNSYFAQAAFADDLKGRKQSNVARVKSFWADIDVGKENNSYATLDEALLAVVSFCKETRLQPTYIISSGRGCYVYWCLDRGIKPGAWKKLAEWLAEAMRVKGLVFDPACTTDSARVLRLPFTIHQGSGNRVTVLGHSNKIYTVEEWVTLMKDVCPPTWDVTPTAPVPAPVRGNALFDSSSGFGSSPVMASAEPVVNGCRQVREAGLGAEPQWYAMMSVMRRCVDGHEWAHKLSAMDAARYDVGDTDKKFAHAPEDSPARCATFENLNPQGCEGCKWRGVITSPIQIWRKAGATTTQEEAAEEKPAPSEPIDQLDLPPKFQTPERLLATPEFWVDDRGCWWRETTCDKAGNVSTVDHQITMTKIAYVKTIWTHDKHTVERKHVFRITPPNGHKEEVFFPAEAMSSSQKLLTWMYNVNILPTSTKYGAKIFMSFMNAYLHAVMSNNQMKEVATTDTFGWKKEDPAAGQRAGFALGEGLVTEDGVEQIEYSGVAAKLSQGLRSAGTLEGWKPVANMYKTLDQKAAQLAMCLSFAAPLMKYGSGMATSATFSLWSQKSGMGKTQLLRAAASVWGHPDGQWIQRNASAVARMRQLAVLNNLPAFMDELTDVKDEDLYSLAYSLVGGQEKNKLRRNGVEMADTGTWNTVTFCTSNKSIKEAVAHCAGDSSASVVRVIEYECDFKSYADDSQIQNYINQCTSLCVSNYGVAGPNFMWQVIRHSDRLATLTAQCEKWVCDNKFNNENRFMAYPLALALKAGRWAVEWGILDYDMDELEEWVLKTFVPHNLGRTVEQVVRPKTLLLTYLTERQRNLVQVSEDYRTTPVPAPGMPDPYVQIAPTNADILLRYAVKENRLYITKSDLTKWCQRQGRSAHNLVRSLVRDEGIRMSELTYNLDSGIGTRTLPTVVCYMLEGPNVDRIGFKSALPEVKPTNVVATPFK